MGYSRQDYMLLWVAAILIGLLSFACFFHFRYQYENRQTDEKPIFIYSQGKTALVEALFFFRVNHLRNNPRGLWLMIESCWPLTMTMFAGILLVSFCAYLYDERILTVSDLMNEQFRTSSLEQASKAPDPAIECPKFDLPNSPPSQNTTSTTGASRNVASVDVKRETASLVEPQKGKYSFLLLVWMAFFTASFTNYLVKSRFHADKWAVCNKQLLEIFNDSKTTRDFTNKKWRRFGHDLIITGMWNHRSFSKYFRKIVFANWKDQRKEECFQGILSEHEALRLLSDV